MVEITMSPMKMMHTMQNKIDSHKDKEERLEPMKEMANQIQQTQQKQQTLQVSNDECQWCPLTGTSENDGAQPSGTASEPAFDFAKVPPRRSAAQSGCGLINGSDLLAMRKESAR